MVFQVAAHLLLFLSLGTPRPVCWPFASESICDLYVPINCDTIRSPAPESTLNFWKWFFWLVLSPQFSVPSPPRPYVPRCRFLKMFFAAHSCQFTLFVKHDKLGTWFLIFVQPACCHAGTFRWSGRQLRELLQSLLSLHCWCGVGFIRQVVSALKSAFSRSAAAQPTPSWVIDVAFIAS